MLKNETEYVLECEMARSIGNIKVNSLLVYDGAADCNITVTLADNNINPVADLSSFPALADHPHKILSFLRLRTADSFVGIDPGKRSFVVSHDLVGIVSDLCIEVHFLLVGIG